MRLRDHMQVAGGRYRELSTNSAQAFRDDVLYPELQKQHPVQIDLSKVYGLGSSFLEETFGGIIVKMGWTKKSDFDQNIQIISDKNEIKLEAETYVKEQIERIKNGDRARKWNP